MSAAELRKAAETLRERAHAAPEGPWTQHPTWQFDVLSASGGKIAGAQNAQPVVAAYIATMHPGVGLALADWLDAMADHDASEYLPMESGAYAVARLINGGAA